MPARSTVPAPNAEEVTELALVDVVRAVQFVSPVSEAARAAPGAGLVLERCTETRLVQRPGRLRCAHENPARENSLGQLFAIHSNQYFQRQYFKPKMSHKTVPPTQCGPQRLRGTSSYFQRE